MKVTRKQVRQLRAEEDALVAARPRLPLAGKGSLRRGDQAAGPERAVTKGAWGAGLAAPRRRHETGRMNKMEAAYAAHLDARIAAGTVAAYAFEPLKLRLADLTYYTPDFLVQRPDGTLEAHEIKGFWEDDARVKFKVAAELHSWLRFCAVRRIAKKHGGGWEITAAFSEDMEVLGSTEPLF